MQPVQIVENVYDVGVQDWAVRDFHGYKTERGATYNSYLIMDEKITLIDTVKAPFTEELLRNISKVTPLESIECIVINHVEPDHSGAMPALAKACPKAKFYITMQGKNEAIQHYGDIFNFEVVKDGATLNIGKRTLTFASMAMLHWPDSMMTYLTGDAVLFSNDAFGQHYCDEHLFNDEVDQTELFEQCQRYYANILTPFSRLVTPKITEILGFNLPVDMIATSHGVVWRDNPTQIVELYLKWAADYQEDRITIFYDTMSNNTRMMADAIAQGIAETDHAWR